MKISDETLQKIHDTSIVTVADKLGIKLYGMGDENRKACCPYHEDQHPSLHFSTKRGCFKCFVCGAKGDAIKLVQDQEKLNFTEACEWIIKECNIIVTDDVQPTAGNPKKSNQKSAKTEKSASEACPHVVVPLDGTLVNKSLSVDSVFAKAVAAQGYLSQGQLVAAANRYRLGASKEGGVIFWEIDDQQRVHTGKIMYYHPDCHRDKEHKPTWVHKLMQDKLPAGYELQHCLFGLHLLVGQPVAGGSSVAGKKVAIVESEKTAVIMSEVVRDVVWMSCGGLQMFKAELLAPLVNHKVIIFPDTDETGEAYKAWLTVLQQAQRQYAFRFPLRISRLLEDHATPEQKARKIDIVDYLFDKV